MDIWGKDGGGVYVFSLLMFTRSLDNVPQANIVKERPCMHAYTTQTIFMLLPVIFVNILSHSSTYMILSFSFTHTATLSLPPSVAIALSRREKVLLIECSYLKNILFKNGSKIKAHVKN